MNTAHLVAWLTCLILAFLACVLGVFNAGSRMALDREVQRLGAVVESMPMPGDRLEAKLSHAEKELEEINAELEQILREEPSDIPAELRDELTGLQQRLSGLHRELQ